MAYNGPVTLNDGKIYGSPEPGGQPVPNAASVDPRPSADSAPTGGFELNKSQTSTAGTTKIAGTDGNNAFSITDLQKDSDQIIATGAGNDIFRWNGAEGVKAGNGTRDVNGIIKFGADAEQNTGDQVFLANQISDYEFSLRADGGIKIHYIGSTDGAAITFYGADEFTFRNIVDVDSNNLVDGINYELVGGTNYENVTYTHDELYAMILAAQAQYDLV